MRKSLRLSSIGLAELREPPPPPVRNFSTKFSLTSYTKRVHELTESQRSAISRTGFGNLLLIPNHSLNRGLLTELMENWSCEKQCFVLDCGEIRMTLLDVALILGLPVVGDPVVLKEDEPYLDLEEEFGATKGKRKVAIASLEARLDSLGESVGDDFVRTFLLYTIGTFLSSNGKVDSRYLVFLRNLDDVCEFAWGAAVVEDLAQWLDKRKESNVQYVGGCLIFLQTWSYEHFDIARPHFQDHDLTFPRVCRWDNSKCHLRQRVTSRFKDLRDDQVIWILQPTSGELRTEIIKEALEMLGDNKELQNAENSSTSTSTSVHGVDSDLQLSISKIHIEEVNFGKQVVEDTPTKLTTFDGEYREQVNLENLIVEDTPPNLSTCDEVHRKQEMNLENLIVVDTPPNLSICDEVHRKQEMNLENLIAVDTPPNLSICGEVHRKQEMNLENLIVVDTPPNLSICEEVHRKQVMKLENLIVEDSPTSLSMADEVGREEFNAEKLIVDDTPPKLTFSDDDLRKKNVLLEAENVELKMIIGQLMEENGLLRRQILSSKQFEEQNAELKKDLDILREENRILRLDINCFLDRFDRHVLDFETNESEQTCHP